MTILLTLGAFLLRLWGTQPFSTRLVPALLGAASVGLLSRLGRDLLAGRAGDLAALFLLVSPIHVLSSQRDTPRSATLFLLLVSLLLMRLAELHPSKSVWFSYGLALGLLPIDQPAAGAYFFLELAWLGARGRDRVGAAAAALLGALVFFVGWRLGLVGPSAGYAQADPSWAGAATPLSVLRCAGASFTRIAGIEYHLLGLHARHVAPLTLLVLALMAWGALRTERALRAFLVAGAALPLCVGVVTALSFGHILPLKAANLIVGLPFFALLVAQGLAALEPWAAWCAGTVVLGSAAASLALERSLP